MATFRDICTDALRKVGVLPHSTTAQAWQIDRALETLNFMIDSWNADDYVIYTKQRTVYPLTSGESCYTIGPGGSFDTEDRDIKLVSALINKSGSDPCCDGPGSQEFPMTYCAIQDWQQIVSKCVDSSWPQFYYLDNAWPLRLLKVYPIPIETSWIVLYTNKVLSQVTNIDEEVSLPPGYKWMIVNNLAVQLATDFSIPPDPMLIKAANDSMAVIKRSNETVDYQYADPAFNMGGNAGRFNILTNTFTPGIGR